ncbi:hypothetical protein PSA7680_00947 [Pseudoruegeria aquimaris]|uniref:Uncharacterized protein n=1 Tax=Pseudoruegeria aquimaris TaxID=393663 RepID=A0A1Y5RQL2_9RHOB|nr:hypothetical protein [Pseudoruegeria aquimaris]SLN23066.1 hypothetical protein PSA7680_00947 [Pseudoruegeria aquimaris]
MPDPIAVLTGDLIRSTDHPPNVVDAAMGVLSEAAQSVAGWQGSPTRFTRARGDGWQMVLMRPALALRASLCLRAALRAADLGLSTRISAGIGDGTLPASGDLAAAAGPAFIASGRGLEAFARRQALGLSGAVQPGAQAAFLLADALARGWTAAQARVLTAALAPEAPTQDELAHALGQTQQNVQKTLRAVHADSLLAALEAFEAPETGA